MPFSEITCWAVASLCLSYTIAFEDSFRILIKQNKVPKDIAEKARIYDTDDFYDLYGRGILEYIVIPYLAKDSPSFTFTLTIPTK